MFNIGSIIYFNLFHFTNSSSASKSKYFVVIKQIDNVAVLAGLPSSQKHLPYTLQSKYGCLEFPDRGIGCYAFQANSIVSENGFSFPLDSYIYGQHLDEYYIENIIDWYPLEGIDYEIKGTLLPEIFEDIVTCLKNSASVKKRFKRYLNT